MIVSEKQIFIYICINTLINADFYLHKNYMKCLFLELYRQLETNKQNA